MAPQEKSNWSPEPLVSQAGSKDIATPAVPESKDKIVLPVAPFVQKLQDTYGDYLDEGNAPIFMELNTALGGLTETTPGDKTMPGKLIAQENSINMKMGALTDDQKTSVFILPIIKEAIAECQEEQARTKDIQVNMKEVEVNTKTEKIDIIEKVQANEGTAEAKESKAESEKGKAETVENKARESAKINTAEIEKLLEEAGGIEKIIGADYNALLASTIEKREVENKANGKTLNKEDLQTEARTQIFLNNREKIEKACPGAAGYFQWLKESADTLKISYDTTSVKEIPSAAKIIGETIQNDPSFSKDKTVLRQGNELIAQASDGSKEIWNMSDRPPTKRVELSTLSIASRVKFEPNFKFLTEEFELTQEISGYKETIKERAKDIEESQKRGLAVYAIMCKPSALINIPNATVQELGIDPKTLVGTDVEGQKKLDLEKEACLEATEEIKNLNKKIKIAEDKLVALREEESLRVANYQKAMKAEAESYRDNLASMNELCFDTVGQLWLNTILPLFNKKRKNAEMGVSEMELWDAFTVSMKNDFARVMQHFLGQEGKWLIVKGPGWNLSVSPENGARDKIKAILTAKGFNASLTDPTERIKASMSTLDLKKPMEYTDSDVKEGKK